MSAESDERQRMAFTLRVAGLTFADIAAHQHEDGRLYSDASGAYRAVKAYMDRHGHGDDLLEQRNIDMARFDSLQRAMWRKAINGDIAAAKFVLEIMKAREKLLGVQGYQPPTGAEDPLDELAKRREAG